jgi:hypothetical protein
MAPTADSILPDTLLGMTAVTGLVDAASFLSLGHVFTMRNQCRRRLSSHSSLSSHISARPLFSFPRVTLFSAEATLRGDRLRTRSPSIQQRERSFPNIELAEQELNFAKFEDIRNAPAFRALPNKLDRVSIRPFVSHRVN